MAALQDCFVDADGSCFVYEISVRHCEARGTSVCMVTYIQTYIHTYLYVLGLPDYVTADVMCLLYVARPVKGSKNMCEITIISQVSHINLCVCMYVCMHVCMYMHCIACLSGRHPKQELEFAIFSSQQQERWKQRNR